MSHTVHARVVARAAELLGGPFELCARLRVSLHEIERWLAGEIRPPAYVFLHCVDVIAERGAEPDTARALRLALLARAAPESPARRELSVEALAATEFGARDGALLLDMAMNAALSSTRAQRCNIQLASSEGLRIVGEVGFLPPFLNFFRVVGEDTPTACGKAHERAAQVVVADVGTDPIFAGTHAREVMLEAGAYACVSTPILGRGATPVGMLSTHYESPHDPAPAELAALGMVARAASRWLGGRAPDFAA